MCTLKENHTGLELSEDENIMTEFSFLDKLSFHVNLQIPLI